MNTTISHTRFDSPLGPMLATAEDGALTGLYFIGQRYFPEPRDDWREEDDATPFPALRAQLGEYFAGVRREFDLPLAPISVIIPCHRIVGTDGSLTGYAGGLERKRTMLAFEHATARTSDAPPRPIGHFKSDAPDARATARTSMATIPLPI
jgi:methylated-DNA-[protein]-cysteine S-methyltransferase